MPRPLLVFAHGWGFDRSFWRPLQEELREFDQIALDFGYFKAERFIGPIPSGKKIIAIGHSFGVLWLLRQQPFSWDALLSINGFSRFIAGEGFPFGEEPRILRRMLSEFDRRPGMVLAQFRDRCGASDLPRAELDVSRLRADLAALSEWDARGNLSADHRPLRVLASPDDDIVPAPLTTGSFSPSTEIRWSMTRGHLLPLAGPDWCAAEIRNFADRLGFVA